ncbi:KH domain-containing protein [Candidatus Peregrinibacteria bacterium]|jgi:hypothetical protein|nr:KH domain-containing protein [Candidatus Peregrinibacteria bacterium]MBT3598356.1 KH domain-containing protein [Candidatus Peregrinibacteria bacterium]MBT4367358.1 KH domain-containing protein [Candidatus Peregrinibacteria bacterium]MBT4585544.1 KH domain-containing protein [Candidatus Peregrinibacteria bacterium]MBT6731359.1 KH domain-containing protein [Candidatus Peregrinibacteria bacterium]
MDDTSTNNDAQLPGEEFLKYVLGNLVEEPDSVSLESREDDLGILHTIKVADADMGKLIGKGGQTIKALRTLLRVIGSDSAKRVNLKVEEPSQV